MLVFYAAIVLALGLLASGAPVFAAFGLSAIVASLYVAHLPPGAIGDLFFNSINKTPLLAAPFFILAGNLMTFGGPSRALVRFMQDLMGHFTAGLGIGSVLACAMFASVSGSGLATGLAVGTMMVPELVKTGYPKPLGVAIVANCGMLGIMIPPSITFIILADVTGAPTGRLFAAGLIPGILITLLCCVAVLFGVRGKNIAPAPRAAWRQRGNSFVRAIPVLFMPVVVLGGIYGGVFTPTEAAVVATVYALVLGGVVYRELNWDNLVKALTGSLRSTTIIFFIIGAAVLFGNVLTFMRVPQTLTQLVLGYQLSQMQFTMFVAILFIGFGMVFEGMVVHYVALPLLMPAALLLQIDLVPFCIMLTANAMIGNITPPVAVQLYGVSGGLGEDPLKVFRESWPFLTAVVVGMAIIILVPELSNFLPNLLGL